MKNYLSYIAIHAVDHCNQSCVFCNNHSVFFKKKQYKTEDFSRWIDTLLEKRMLKFGTLSIIGGEPFLHEDLLEFISGFKKRYDPMNIQVITNGFWLKTKEDIDKRQDVLDSINRLIVTRYPNMLSKEKFDESIEYLKSRHSFGFNPLAEKGYAKQVDSCFEIWGVENWGSFEFLNAPEEVKSFCHAQANCTQLLADGRLTRCATAGYADKNPLATKAFLENRKDIFFDVKNEERSISEWRNKWPLDACSYCTMWKENKTKWANKPEMRNADAEELKKMQSSKPKIF